MPGSPRAVVAKLNSAGQEVFAKLFDSAGDSEVVDIQFGDNGDLFVMGHFSESIDLGGGTLTAAGSAKEVFVARFDPTGTLIYGRRVGGNGVDDPAAMAHIGDLRRTDIAGALGMGMTAVRFRGVIDDPETEENPQEGDHVIDRHDQLLDALGLN